MSLLALRDAVVTALKAGLPSVTDIEGHGGRFTAQELRRFSLAGPAVRVALLAVTRAIEERGGTVEVTAQLAAFIATKTKPGVPRDAAGLILVDAVLQIVTGNDWGQAEAQRPEAVRAQNLYSAELDKHGAAIWAVDWRQTICLGGLDEATLDDLTTYHVTYDVGQTPGTENPEDTVENLDQ